MAGSPDQSLAANEDQQIIREAALQFLQEEQALARVRAQRDGDEAAGIAPAFWDEISALGWPGLLAPEEHGGSGLGFQELGVVFEALGRHVVASPLFSSGVLAASALSIVDGWAGLEKTHGLATGEQRAALALEESPRFDPYAIATVARQTPDGYALTGHKRPVLDAAAADVLLVVARIGSQASDEVGLFRVDPQAQGVATTPLRWLDGRRAAELSFDAVALSGDALLGTPRPMAELVEPLVDRAAAALAAELVGTMASAFELTLDFLKTREQFDQKLAQFQALQHRTARMFADIESTISLVQDALRAIDEGDADSSAAASAAKAQASAVARQVTAEALQLFGGLGMTEEQDIGLYFKRAQASSTLFGDAAHHYARFAGLSGF
jgi:alkylation response protein AidB-like acyl-CoA dehydrogenase